jgi:hypothetical protein
MTPPPWSRYSVFFIARRFRSREVADGFRVTLHLSIDPLRKVGGDLLLYSELFIRENTGRMTAGA